MQSIFEVQAAVRAVYVSEANSGPASRAAGICSEAVEHGHYLFLSCHFWVPGQSALAEWGLIRMAAYRKGSGGGIPLPALISI